MDDNELRRRFAQLREADRERAPSFAQMHAGDRQRAGDRRPRRATLRVRPIAFGTVATAMTVATIWFTQARSAAPPPAVPAIATWRASTDVLLRTPGSDVLGTMPALGASVLDSMIAASFTNKGA